jgi:hypothetical protein
MDCRVGAENFARQVSLRSGKVTDDGPSLFGDEGSRGDIAA